MRPPKITEISTLDPEGLFTIQEAARVLGYTYEGLRRKLKKENTPVIRRGGTRFVRGSYIQKQVNIDVFM